MDQLLSTVRFARRALVRHFRFTLLAILCLGIAIGGNTALFSLVDTLLLQQFPVKDPNRLVHLMNVFQGEGEAQVTSLSMFNFFAFQSEGEGFESLEALLDTGYNLRSDRGTESVPTAEVTAGFLPSLGAGLAKGRHFAAGEEDRPNGPKVVILSHEIWRSRFHSDPDILDRGLDLDDSTYTVVGVLEEGFTPMISQASLFVPLQADPADAGMNARRFHQIQAIGRLAEGATLEQAASRLDVVSARLAEEYPRSNQGWSARLIPFRELFVRELRPRLLALQAAAACVLLIACANLASFLLVQAERRSGDTAVRVAMGATRKTIALQFLAESLIVSLLGAIVGLLLAAWAKGPLGGLTALGSMGTLVRGSTLDARVVGAALLTAVVIGVVFSLVLTARSFRGDLVTRLKSGSAGGGGGGQRVLSGLVVGEVALALLVSVAAGLVLQSFRNMSRVDLGFETRDLVLLSLDLPRNLYPEGPKRRQFVDDLTRRLEALPGVDRVAASNLLPPLHPGGRVGTFNVENRPDLSSQGMLFARYYLVSSNYLETMRIPLVDGRYFDARETADGTGAVILSQAMKERYWPEENALGKRIKRGPEPLPEVPWLTVVGIVEDVHDTGAASPVDPVFYLPYAQHASTDPALTVQMLLAGSEVEGQMGVLREKVWEIDRNVSVQQVATMDDYAGAGTRDEELGVTLYLLFGGLALLLVVLGIYGLMTNFVALRRREMGIRMAFGARGVDLLLWVLKRGAGLAAFGVVFGLATSFLLTRFMESQLFGIQALDKATLAGVVVLILLVATIACLLPARRASKLDPTTSLRFE